MALSRDPLRAAENRIFSSHTSLPLIWLDPLICTIEGWMALRARATEATGSDRPCPGSRPFAASHRFAARMRSTCFLFLPKNACLLCRELHTQAGEVFWKNVSRVSIFQISVICIVRCVKPRLYRWHFGVHPNTANHRHYKLVHFMQRFPWSRRDFCSRWVANLRRDKWRPSPGSSLCSDHFAESCFDRTRARTRL